MIFLPSAVRCCGAGLRPGGLARFWQHAQLPPRRQVQLEAIKLPHLGHPIRQSNRPLYEIHVKGQSGETGEKSCESLLRLCGP